MLSKDSMKGMDLLAVSTDALYALEQISTGKGGKLTEELSTKLDQGITLLEFLSSATNAQVTNQAIQDVFMIRLAESLEKATGLPPSKLSEMLSSIKSQLKSRKASDEAFKMFERISDSVLGLTSRSVEAVSTSLQ